jgi:hypothetical protein
MSTLPGRLRRSTRFRSVEGVDSDRRQSAFSAAERMRWVNLGLNPPPPRLYNVGYEFRAHPCLVQASLRRRLPLARLRRCVVLGAPQPALQLVPKSPPAAVARRRVVPGAGQPFRQKHQSVGIRCLSCGSAAAFSASVRLNMQIGLKRSQTRSFPCAHRACDAEMVRANSPSNAPPSPR